MKSNSRHKLEKGCLIKLSGSYLRFDRKKKKLLFPGVIKDFFIKRVANDNEFHSHDDHKEESLVGYWFVCENENAPFLYLDYWSIPLGKKTHGADPIIEHHFRVLFEEKMLDLIFVTEMGFSAPELFEVIQ